MGYAEGKDAEAEGSHAKDLVLAYLEADQLAAAKQHRLPRRRLTRAQTFLLVLMRGYLIFMVAVIIYQLVHPSGGG